MLDLRRRLGYPAVPEVVVVVVTSLSKQFGGQVLFTDVDLRFDPGKVYGIVGANGSGKSTLLRILSGQETASAGDVTIPKRCRLGVLEQDHYQYEDVRILDVVLMGDKELWDAVQEKEVMLEGPEEDFDVDRYTHLEETILRLDGYTAESRAAEILAGLGIPTDRHEEPLSVLSGGYKLRVLLAQVLASKPDVLFLDEPTNHLDIVSVDWLEGFLRSFEGTVGVVSHDHAFLDNVCTHIVDVDYQRVRVYTGNFTAFEEAKEEDRARMEGEIDKRKKEIADHKAFIARFKAKATKARQASSRAKRLAKIQIEDLPQSSRRYPYFNFEQTRPSGREVLEIDGVGKMYDDNIVLADVSVKIMRGERVAIIGPNGIGKSTLLEIATGGVQADEGTISWGHEAHVGMFHQENSDLFSGKQTLQGWLMDRFPTETIGFIRGKLAEVLFTQDEVDKQIEALSGGEEARLVFCWLAAQKPNVLVLDEPTNHLDLEGIEALAAGLSEYEGTLLFVSHNRWFVRNLATRIIELSRDGIFDFRGTYDEFVRHRQTDHLDQQAVLEADAEKRRGKKRKKRG